jgi:hypothetical protein
MYLKNWRVSSVEKKAAGLKVHLFKKKENDLQALGHA